MSMINSYYNIHDIIKIQSEIPLFELEYFQCDKTPEPDMIIKKKSVITKKLKFGRTLFDDEFNSNKKIKYSEHFGLLGSQFEIDFSGPITISVNNLIAKSKHVLYVNLVEPIMRFLMLSKDYVLLHSACLGLGENSILLSAPPDTGKTTTVLKCIKNGFHFLSDDMTIIKLPCTAMCFPKPMTISSHTFKTAVDVAEDTSNKFGLKLRSLVHSKRGRQFMRDLSKHNVPIFTFNTIGQMLIRPPKYRISDISKSIQIKNESKVIAIGFLKKEGEKITNLDKESALKQAIENSDDAFLFPPYRELFPYINIDGKSAHELLQKEKQMVEELLKNISSYELQSESRRWNEMSESICIEKILNYMK